MPAATITQAQDKGLRHHFSNLGASVRAFCAGLYAAHGGWQDAQPALMSLASQAESHSPGLSVELRYLASRG